MKRMYITAILACLMTAGAASSQMTGKQVMEEQKKRHEIKSETVVNAMLLVDAKGEKEQRVIKSYFKDLGNGETRMLVVFSDPASVKGTAMLSWNHNGRQNDQWLYLPSQKKLQRIAEGSKKNAFMGTDLTFEDMEGEELDNFNYNLMKDEALDGKDCFVVEAVPAGDEQKRNSGYAKRKLWVRKDIFFTVKVEFYDQRGDLQKTLTNLDLKNVGGTVWRANKALMDNHKRNHKTLVAVQSETINPKLDDAVFTEGYILSEKHIQ
jgi:hypothetical protein